MALGLISAFSAQNSGLLDFNLAIQACFFVRAVILIFFLLLTSLSHFVLEVIFICGTIHRGLEKSKCIFQSQGASWTQFPCL